MDLKIIEIASHTENQKIIKNYTHQSKNKNPICGDEMKISFSSFSGSFSSKCSDLK